MAHCRDFVKLAHSKVIQDVVINHAGSVFCYDADGDDLFDQTERDEWIPPFKRDGFYDNAKWINIPKWNALCTQSDGRRNLLGVKVVTKGTLSQLASCGRKVLSDDSLVVSQTERESPVIFSHYGTYGLIRTVITLTRWSMSWWKSIISTLLRWESMARGLIP